MNRNWEEDLKAFENFLRGVNLQKYAYLRGIKTVEQDLPKDLLPLGIFYRHYWDTTDFKDYEEVFAIYWREKLSPHVYDFIKKYFYGCSLQFVEEGFKARLYRIWMSILTQFHFQYLWNALFPEKLVSSAELDTMGIDAIVELDGVKVAFQVKKVSYRREASERRFSKKQQRYADIVVEVPYLVVDVAELEGKIANPRVRRSTKVKYRNVLKVFDRNFARLDNGFVIFKREYLQHIHETVLRKLGTIEKGRR